MTPDRGLEEVIPTSHRGHSSLLPVLCHLNVIPFVVLKNITSGAMFGAGVEQILIRWTHEIPTKSKQMMCGKYPHPRWLLVLALPLEKNVQQMWSIEEWWLAHKLDRRRSAFFSLEHGHADGYFAVGIQWVFPKIGVPQNGWFIMEKSFKWMLWWYPYFRKHPLERIPMAVCHSAICLLCCWSFPACRGRKCLHHVGPIHVFFQCLGRISNLMTRYLESWIGSNNKYPTKQSP